MTRSRPDGDYSADFKEGLGKETAKGKARRCSNASLGFELTKREHPLTGEDVSRDYSRSYGCSGTSCSAAMDFFRSGTIGMYDRLEDSGMRNISGIRSGCGQTLIPAFGMLLYSESASDCLCSYSFATSLALAPAASRRNEDWALFDDKQLAAGLVRRSALNLGAPGDRRDPDGTLWLGYPRPSLGRRPRRRPGNFPYSFEAARASAPIASTPIAGRSQNTDRPWIYGSGIKGLTRLKMDLVHHQPSKVLLSLSPGQAPKIDGDLDRRLLGRLRRPAVGRPQRERLFPPRRRSSVRRLRAKSPPRSPRQDAAVEGVGAAERTAISTRTITFVCRSSIPKGTRVVTFAVTAAGGTVRCPARSGQEMARSRTSACRFRPRTPPGTASGRPRRSERPRRSGPRSPFPGRPSPTPAFDARTLHVECQRRTALGERQGREPGCGSSRTASRSSRSRSRHRADSWFGCISRNWTTSAPANEFSMSHCKAERSSRISTSSKKAGGRFRAIVAGDSETSKPIGSSRFASFRKRDR